VAQQTAEGLGEERSRPDQVRPMSRNDQGADDVTVLHHDRIDEDAPFNARTTHENPPKGILPVN